MTEERPEAAVDANADARLDPHRMARAIDRLVHAAVARRTGGLLLIALGQVWWDCAAHLAASPGRQMELAASAAAKAVKLTGDAIGSDLELNDIRYRDPAWRTWPFNMLAAVHKAQEDWWAEATTGLPGVSAEHERVATFIARQVLDMLAPPNLMLTNPEVQRKTWRQGGRNLIRGARHMAEDMALAATGQPPAGMDDYLDLGVMAALDAVCRIVPGAGIHAAGYCLGGTLQTIAAAAMGREGDDRLASVSLLAAQADFTEAGELGLFINDSQLALLEDMMWRQGVLKPEQMAGTFHNLKSNDLIWSRMIREYMPGERGEPSDLMAWNADATRMPYRMHSEYLRRLFLDNDLAEGRFEVAGTAVALTDIRGPVFAVGTERDHVAPWKSAYKIQRLTDTDVTLVVASGGHNGGIVSEPGHAGRTNRQHTTRHGNAYVDADAWAVRAEPHQGSWWTAWAAWLGERSGPLADPPAMGAPGAGLEPLDAAPGTYVFQK